MPIQDLSNDLIIEIAKQLNRDSNRTAHLFAFAQVCKRWSHCGLPIFYGNIEIGNKALETFVQSFNISKYARLVHSLTLRIDTDHGRHPNITSLFPQLPAFATSTFTPFGSEPAALNDSISIEKTLPERLVKCIDLVPNFQNLLSCSLRLEASPYRSIPRTTLIKLLKTLPEKCINLEIDTGAQDHRQSHEDAHVCEAVRDLLPRMRHVRIRVGAMCSAMFGTGGFLSDEYTAAKIPNMKSLIVSCAVFNGQQVQGCGPRDYTTSAKHPSYGSLAWSSVTNGLTKIVEQNEENLDGVSIYAMNAAAGDDQSQLCHTAVRTNIVAKETSAFPIIRLSRPFEQEIWEVRLQDDSDMVLSFTRHVESIAEGQIWQDVLGGARLPADALQAEQAGFRSFAAGCAALPIGEMSEQAWIAEHSNNIFPTILRREEKVRAKLVRAEKRTGSDYRGLMPIRELTPQGWFRTMGGLDLEQIR